MSDNLVFFVPHDGDYTFDDITSELSCTYCTINSWQIQNKDDNGLWYALNITWDTTGRDAVVRLQSALFVGAAYIYVSHSISKVKTIFHDVNIYCPRIYDYPNLYKQYKELLDTHSNVTYELSRIKEKNQEVESDIMDDSYKEITQYCKQLESEIKSLHERNGQLFDSYPQHCS